MSSLFKGYSIFEDPDEDSDIFLVTTNESIVYASWSELKAQEAAEILDLFFENIEKEEEITIYSVPLDDFLLIDEELDQLEVFLEETEEEDDRE